MGNQGSAVNSGVQSGVDGVGLGGQADGDGLVGAVNGGVVEVLVAQGVSEEAFHGVIHHVDVGVEVQGNDSAGAHQQVLCLVHQSVTGVVVGAGLDQGDDDVIGLSPGAVLNLDIVTQVGQIQVVDSQGSVVFLAELNVVVTGTGGPHIQEADGIVVVSQPAVTSDGVVAVLTGVQEGVPLLVLQVHGDADACQSALQVFTDGLVCFGGVVQVGQSGEVGQLAHLVDFVVLAQDVVSFFVVGLESLLVDVVVAVELVAGAGVLVELGAVSVGHAHCNEGRCGNLTCLTDLINDVVAVEQQGNCVADFCLSSGLLLSGHFCRSGLVAGGGSGGVSRGFGSGGVVATASSQGQNHGQGQQQSNQFLHSIFLLKERFISYLYRGTAYRNETDVKPYIVIS